MTTKLQKRDAATSAIARLPFVCDTPEDSDRPRLFWCARPSGDYGADCATGVSYGLAALRHMRDENFTPLLGWIVSDMISQENGNGSLDLTHNGLVTGFCAAIAASAVACASEPYLERLEKHYRNAERAADV